MPTLELETTAYTAEQFPALDSPQVAFAGRSNVGKSSLINALAGRKTLAKISSTPGKTRSLNFYRVTGEALYLVDLPGYGYAKRSKTERNQWAALINSYFAQSSGLKAVLMLLDTRLAPQKLDLELVSFLQREGTPLIAVLTKADKCKNKERAQAQRQWGDLLGAQTPLILFSAKTGLGNSRLWTAIREAVGDDGSA
ncbi:MAG: ribosome biogenesis GTP-binding protein YihA/YsxC [Thermodesulfobacteriota bacterium]